MAGFTCSSSCIWFKLQCQRPSVTHNDKKVSVIRDFSFRIEQHKILCIETSIIRQPK